MPTAAISANRITCEPNITPMLDVLLVLLIIFMAVTIQVHHTLDVQLPQACVADCGGGDAIVLEVRPGPTYVVNHAPIPNDMLAQHLSAIYHGRPNKVLQLAGYPGTTYQEVIHAMDTARSAGVRVVAIMPKESYVSR